MYSWKLEGSGREQSFVGLMVIRGGADSPVWASPLCLVADVQHEVHTYGLPRTCDLLGSSST